MSATLEAPSAPPGESGGARPRASLWRRGLGLGPATRIVRYAIPTLVTAANAIAFALVRPDVNDLVAARARASAVAHDVGLTYWFSWFGGGATPGSYSLLTPQISAAIGTEVLCAIAAVAVAVVGTFAVQGTRHPLAGAWVVAAGATINLWSGRVPFLVGGAVAIGALIALRHRHRWLTVVLTLLSVAASPVAGAFLVLGLSGTFITTRTREWRPIIAWCTAAVGVAGIAVTIVFGTPGPEPFNPGIALEVVGGLLLLWFATPPDHVRTTIYWSFAAVVVLFVVPNGLGSNITRFVFFCLPVAVLAMTHRPVKVAAAIVAPVVLAGAIATTVDLVNAARPISSIGFYKPLAAKLTDVADLRNYRVEVVNHGAHAGYDALLNDVMLARGWETQEDTALNQSLRQDPLDPITYRVWLANNAVGYVALPSVSVGEYPEFNLVRDRTPSYLRQIWESDDWRLFRVVDPTPIAALPSEVVAHSQSTLSVRVPCACKVPLRVRWSKFLTATLRVKPGQRPPPGDEPRVADDGFGWTTLTTSRAGTYDLAGSLRGGFGGFLR